MGFNLKKMFGLGGLGSSGDAPHLRQLALDQLLGLKVPDAVDFGASAFDSIQEDPGARDAEMSALSKLADYSNDGGTARTKANLETIKDELNTTSRGNREAVLENARRRGTAGSGLEQANDLLSSQDASTNAYKAGVDEAGAAEDRALQAITAGAKVGGDVRGQDYQIAAKKAEAADAIKKFNADQKQQVFDNSFRKAAGVSGGYGDMAAAEEERRRRKDQFTGSMIGTGGSIVTGLAGR